MESATFEALRQRPDSRRARPAPRLATLQEHRCATAVKRARERGVFSPADVAAAAVQVPDKHSLSVWDQRRLDRLIASLEVEVAGAPPGWSPLLEHRRFPSLPQWMAMRNSALALHPIYAPGTMSRLGSGLPEGIFTAPLFDGRSAVQELGDLVGEACAHHRLVRHLAFVEAPMSCAARRLFAGSADGRGIRARAAAAAGFIRRGASRWDRRVSVASVGCGAVGAVADAVGELGASGVAVSELSVLDRDPMALAAGRAVAEAALPDSVIRHRLVDLVDPFRPRAIDLGPFAGLGWDIVDILSPIERLPDRLASDLVRQAILACRPGGIVVLSNMLDVRPQQMFFSNVVQGPATIQRSVGDFAKLILAAGVDPRRVSIVIPAHAPVYAVAAVEVA